MKYFLRSNFFDSFFILSIKVCSRTCEQKKVCAFNGVDLEAGEFILDERCYYTECGRNYELISGSPPAPGRRCEPKRGFSEYAATQPDTSSGYEYRRPSISFH